MPMDSRLLDASWNGNVDTLTELFREDREIIHNAASNGGKNPLYISCLAGHFIFVQALMNLRSDFALEQNPDDGFTPLHIASAKGYLEIARVLLQYYPNLCLFQGTENKIPLHCAVIKGRIEVVRLLIFANRGSIGYVTARGETVLHLAVKNNQFRVFEYMVRNLRRLNQENVLNTKDDHGNTVLHLAVSRKQYQMIKLLLNEEVIAVRTMEYLSSRNRRGLTPLDVLTLSQREAEDMELEDLLRRAGAQETQNFVPGPANQIQQNPPIGQQTSWIRKLINYFMYPKLAGSSGELTNFLLIIAILTVTATYQAAQNPPGGVWQEDRKGVLAAGQIPHDAGKAVFATKNPTGFKIYVFANTIGFYVSLSLICVLTSKFPMRVELLIAMFALCFTYGASLGAISPDTLPDQTSHHLYIATIGVILPLIMVHWYRLDRGRD